VRFQTINCTDADNQTQDIDEKTDRTKRNNPDWPWLTNAKKLNLSPNRDQ